MRVTMLNKYYPPHVGGIEYHLRDLSTALAARGHDVRVIVANEGRDTVAETLSGVTVTRMGRAFAYSSTPVVLGMRRALADAVRGPEPSDLVHLHFPYPWGEASWLAARPSAPTVLSYHSDIVRQRLMLAAYGPVLRRVLDRVDLVLASSPNMVEASPFLSRIADKCRVVPYGIPVERFVATPEIEARAAALKAAFDGRRVVLFVGRLVYYKGADVLVRAMREVDADLVLIGRGPFKAELEALAESVGVGPRMRIVETAGDAELAAWYRAADVFCLPSIARSEAYGLVQLEAHASGLPVVATTLTTSVPFVNEHGVTGLNVTPGDVPALADALRTLLADDALRARLGRQAYERAHEEFTLERMVDRVLAVYHEAGGAG
jgi:rhamnosyl/mannosyltransferase